MPSRLAFKIRKYHKWLSLIIGIQALLWLASGVYMVVFDLDFIHGDHLVQNLAVRLPADRGDLVPFSTIQARYPEAHEIVMASWQGLPHYRVHEKSRSHLIDATTGVQRSPLGERDARAVAQYHYQGSGLIESSRLINAPADAPGEIPLAALPLWQINFGDFGSTALYISAEHGGLVSQRHTFWRIFDFAWMLHIMDYENREDVNNNLLRIAALLGSIMSLFGMWLLYFSFQKNARRQRATAPGGSRE